MNEEIDEWNNEALHAVLIHITSLTSEGSYKPAPRPVYSITRASTASTHAVWG